MHVFCWVEAECFMVLKDQWSISRHVFTGSQIVDSLLPSLSCSIRNDNAGPEKFVLCSNIGGSMDMDMGPLIRAPVSIMDTLTKFLDLGMSTTDMSVEYRFKDFEMGPR